jgi:hypothetical protein
MGCTYPLYGPLAILLRCLGPAPLRYLYRFIYLDETINLVVIL